MCGKIKNTQMQEHRKNSLRPTKQPKPLLYAINPTSKSCMITSG